MLKQWVGENETKSVEYFTKTYSYHLYKFPPHYVLHSALRSVCTENSWIDLNIPITYFYSSNGVNRAAVDKARPVSFVVIRNILYEIKTKSDRFKWTLRNTFTQFFCGLGGHLKNFWFASPDWLFLRTKKPLMFGSENRKIPILQFSKISELFQGKKLQQIG